MPNIYSHTDYREFLREQLALKKSKNCGFSTRAAAIHLGLSTGTLSRVLNGKRSVGPALLPRLISFLGLKSREAEYFTLLVQFSRTVNAAKKRAYYNQILQIRGGKCKEIPKEDHLFFQQWYYPALHQLIKTVPDCSDPEELGLKLIPSVGSAKVKKALLLLQKLGFIRKNEFGGYSAVDQSLTTGEEWSSVAIHCYQSATAKMGVSALERIPKKERDISTLTLCLSKDSFSRAREILRKAREEILLLEGEECVAQRVCQLNFQLFPLSVSREESRES